MSDAVPTSLPTDQRVRLAQIAVSDGLLFGLDHDGRVWWRYVTGSKTDRWELLERPPAEPRPPSAPR